MTSSTGVALEIIGPSRKQEKGQASCQRSHSPRPPRMGVRGTCHVRAKEVVSTVTCKGQDLGLCMSKYATCPTLPKPGL
ncbi:hypothetical protein V8C43DRAFT_267254 [Trichoderma afarasin]